MNKNFISVIVTAYNRKQYLLDALKSAVNQTLPRDKYEIIVVKNFSDVKEIEDYIKKNNIREINVKKKGVMYHIYGIRAAKGNILCFLEDDDLFTKDKLEFIYNNFKDDVVYIRNSYKTVNYKGEVIGGEFNRRIDFNASCISIRKSVIDLRNLDLIKPYFGPDMFAFVSAVGKGKIIRVNKVLSLYRKHNEGVSASYSSTEFKFINLLQKRAGILYKAYHRLHSESAKSIVRWMITENNILLYMRGKHVKITGLLNYLIHMKDMYGIWWTNFLAKRLILILLFEFNRIKKYLAYR
ncbi:MAG: glycosyltransferase family 2 protein [Fervidicoccaceae archaeon]